MMKKNVRLVFCIMSLLIVILSIILSGCQTVYICSDLKTKTTNPQDCKEQYVCPDGKIKTSKSLCTFQKQIKYTVLEAEKIADTYVNAYTETKLIKSRVISTYVTEQSANYTGGDFIVTLIVQDTSKPYMTTLTVDGNTGAVECTKNCQYIKK